MKAIISFKSFPNHKGILGHQGGSLPEGESASAVNSDIVNTWEEDLEFVSKIRAMDASGKHDKEYDTFMEAISHLDAYEGIAYRGINELDLSRSAILKTYDIGKIININAISSASKDINAASYFAVARFDVDENNIVDAPTETAIVLKLMTHDAVDIAAVASIPEQQEVLVRKSEYRITKSMPVSLRTNGERRKFLLVEATQQ